MTGTWEDCPTNIYRMISEKLTYEDMYHETDNKEQKKRNRGFLGFLKKG